VAWFAFEGSFNFFHLLTGDIANQVYAVMDSEGWAIVSVATLSSEAWQERVVRADERVRSDSALRSDE